MPCTHLFWYWSEVSVTEVVQISWTICLYILIRFYVHSFIDIRFLLYQCIDIDITYSCMNIDQISSTQVYIYWSDIIYAHSCLNIDQILYTGFQVKDITDTILFRCWLKDTGTMFSVVKILTIDILFMHELILLVVFHSFC